jgi:hypothetical protein
LGKERKLPPSGAVFSLAARSASQLFFWGDEIWSASKLAHFIVFGRHSRHTPRRDKIEVDTINQ